MVALLREVESQYNIISGFSKCFTDHRDQELIEHSVLDLVSQRIIGIALGYEDLNDHDELSRDHLFAILVGKKDPTGQDRRLEREDGVSVPVPVCVLSFEAIIEDAALRNHTFLEILRNELKKPKFQPGYGALPNSGRCETGAGRFLYGRSNRLRGPDAASQRAGFKTWYRSA